MESSFVQSLHHALHVFTIASINERWSAVQIYLHPCLAHVADQVHLAVAQRFPQQWLLYERSFKSQRYINRGHGQRSPIDEYHVAFDRPPRGCGIIISISGAERAVLVGLQLWGVRKPALERLWSTGRAVWEPLVAHIEQAGQARFTHIERQHQMKRTNQQPATPPAYWIDRYLSSRSATYLWAGFVYPWERFSQEAQLVEDVLALFPLNEALMEQSEGYEPDKSVLLQEQRTIFSVASPLPSIETIVERICSKGFAFSETIVRSYHVALQTRPLVILPGMSGTGKTRLTRLYADAIHHIPSLAHDNPYYIIVAVQPDWHNARDLLGYYNALTGFYHPTPFLRFLLRAAADPQQLYFVCLDEMNLARPEYYLAPILSALETTEHTIDLGIPAEEATTITGETLRNPFRLPLNVRFTGTINVDETTHALSDKLLDRANVIELTDVDLAAFRQTYRGVVDEQVWHTICHIHEIVSRIGQPFGYRTVGEMLRYIEQAQGILPLQQALDLQIKQKILPKVRGEQSPLLRKGLNDLHTLLQELGLDQSAQKVQRMLAKLDMDGFTDFSS